MREEKRTDGKRRTVAIGISLLALFCAVIALLYFSPRTDSDQMRYTGSFGDVSIDFVRYTDYDAFTNAKHPLIMTSDTAEEEKARGYSAFLAGKFHVEGRWYRGVDCGLEILRRKGFKLDGILLYEGDGTSSAAVERDIPFIAYEYDDGHGNSYKEIRLTLDDEVAAVVPLKVAELKE